MSSRASYENGVFRPLDQVKLKEGTVLEIHLPSEDEKRRSLRDLVFAGMRKNRRDITNGVSYVDGLQDNPRA